MTPVIYFVLLLDDDSVDAEELPAPVAAVLPPTAHGSKPRVVMTSFVKKYFNMINISITFCEVILGSGWAAVR